MTTSISRLTALAAKIVDGLSPETTEGLDVPALLAFWAQNKYPLLALNHNNSGGRLQGLAEFKVARQNQEAILSSLREEYVVVRDRWAEAGISCILIKSAGNFPSFPYTSDNLDVLVKEDQAGEAAIILKDLGYIELKNIEEPHKYLFRKFLGGRCVSAIHLHTWIGWNVRFLDNEPVWQNARTAPDDNTVWAPSPEDVILITLAHSFYENKQFRLADIVKVRECWRRAEIDWAYIERAASQRGWLDGLHFCLLTCIHIEKSLWGETSISAQTLHGWETSLKHHPMIYRYYKKITRRTPVSLPFAVSFIFSKFLYYGKILRDRRIGLRQKFAEVIKTLIWGIGLKLHIRLQSGFLVSLSGPDGSGKTEHAHTLATALSLCGLRTRYYWSRCGNSWFIRLLSARGRTFLSSKQDTEQETIGAPGRKGRLQNGIVRFLWSYLVSTDMVITYFFHAKLKLLRGRAVICDRYVYDAAAEMESALPTSDKLNRLAVKLMLSLTPRPDVPYLLDLPEEACAQRKDENTDIEYLQQQRRAYTALAGRYNLRLKRTDREFSDTTDEIIREVLTSYYDTHKTITGSLLRKLFPVNSHELYPQRERVK
ncbi:MAG: nucleotidyltransferase family protein [Dehalococcoidales bacterium]|nr:MAG: nucleotidyltransferase family protein [Dehalococcoidales bacterium]